MLQDLLHFAFFALRQEAREKTGLFFFFSDTAIGGIAFAELAGDRSFAWLTSERNFCRLRLLGLQLSYFYIQNFCQRPKEKTKKIWLQYVVAIFSYLTASTKVGHETSSEGLKYKSHVICVYFWIPKFHENVPFSYPLHTVCKMSEYFSYLSYFMTSLTVVFMSFNCFQGFSGRLETSLSSRSVISDLACSSCSVVIWVNFTHCCKEKYSVITHLCNIRTIFIITLSFSWDMHQTLDQCSLMQNWQQIVAFPVLYTFSILVSIHFARCQSRTIYVGDHFLHSQDLHVWFKGNMMGRNKRSKISGIKGFMQYGRFYIEFFRLLVIFFISNCSLWSLWCWFYS